MKKLIAGVCFTLVLTHSVLAQKNEKPKVSVIWSTDPHCHQSKSKLVCPLAIRPCPEYPVVRVEINKRPISSPQQQLP